ncbi:hypothetical protein [Nocardia sp. CNY236]|uniref:hypothetical protein n=1 Tax=Nocardia sp. CNY236 TaxID=1169152 RepID=UPI00041D0A33|nr:hypothetical protein [Nocardia sp. CNY236]
MAERDEEYAADSLTAKVVAILYDAGFELASGTRLTRAAAITVFADPDVLEEDSANLGRISARTVQSVRSRRCGVRAREGRAGLSGLRGCELHLPLPDLCGDGTAAAWALPLVHR